MTKVPVYPSYFSCFPPLHEEILPTIFPVLAVRSVNFVKSLHLVQFHNSGLCQIFAFSSVLKQSADSQGMLFHLLVVLVIPNIVFA